MRLITSGKMVALIPTFEDFELFRGQGHTDASSRDELINRYNEISDVALLEISVKEFNEKLKKHRSNIEKELHRRGHTVEVEIDGRLVVSSQARAFLAGILVNELGN
jgi:hypothetical protein